LYGIDDREWYFFTVVVLWWKSHYAHTGGWTPLTFPIIRGDWVFQVLLLEAGKPSFNNFKVNVPAAVIRLFKSDLDWQYVSEPEKDLDGKQVYLIRGKV